MLSAPSAWCQRFPQLLHATTTAGTPPPPTTKPPVSGCIVNRVSSMMENWLWPHRSQGLFAPLRCKAEASSLSRVWSIVLLNFVWRRSVRLWTMWPGCESLRLAHSSRLSDLVSEGYRCKPEVVSYCAQLLFRFDFENEVALGCDFISWAEQYSSWRLPGHVHVPHTA